MLKHIHLQIQKMLIVVNGHVEIQSILEDLKNSTRFGHFSNDSLVIRNVTGGIGIGNAKSALAIKAFP